MNWIDIIRIIGISTGPQILLVIIIGFFGKKLIEYFFNKTIEIKKNELAQNIENYKQRLEQENKQIQLSLDKNFETYKNNLDIMRLEFQIQFSGLHEKRLEIIANIYKLLSELNNAVLDFTARAHFIAKNIDTEKEKQDRIIKTNSAFSTFIEYYNPNKIFLTQEIVVKLEKIKEYILEKTQEYSYLKNEVNNTHLENEDGEEYRKILITISEDLKMKIPIIMVDLEHEFRDLLGIKKKIID